VSGDRLAALVELSRALGEPWRELAILAEGNTSARRGEGRIAVKASGTSLATAARDGFVELDTRRALALLDRAEDDAALAAGLAAARVGGDGRPSIEAALHAILVEEAGAEFVGHTHPVAVNQILCSSRAEAIVAGPLFPDQVVVCGRHPLLVPYASPGLPLARLIRDALRRHVAQRRAPPKVVYLRSHGLFALGSSAGEVLQVTEMAVKAARILGGALAVGEPEFLSAEEADALEDREDEAHRRRMLAGRTA
jgi:rhamnose utilization protein RhaD (predicted bifunctional aldolase and dehydrogenase)